DGGRFADATDLPLPHPEVDHRLQRHILSGGEAFAGADPREPRRRLEAEAMLAYVPRDGAAPAGLAPPLWPRGGNLDGRTALGRPGDVRQATGQIDLHLGP